MKDKKSERVKRKRGVSDGLILPDISSILMIIGCKLLFYAPNRALCILYHAKRLISGLKVE